MSAIFGHLHFNSLDHFINTSGAIIMSGFSTTNHKIQSTTVFILSTVVSAYDICSLTTAGRADIPSTNSLTVVSGSSNILVANITVLAAAEGTLLSNLPKFSNINSIGADCFSICCHTNHMSLSFIFFSLSAFISSIDKYLKAGSTNHIVLLPVNHLSHSCAISCHFNISDVRGKTIGAAIANLSLILLYTPSIVVSFAFNSSG